MRLAIHCSLSVSNTCFKCDICYFQVALKISMSSREISFDQWRATSIYRFFVILYLDHILIINATWKEHISHLKHALDTLKEQWISNLMKSEFGKESLAYLGHMISGRVQKVHPTKIEAINKWSTPNSVIEVRSFMGATWYVRKFISTFWTTLAAVHVITKKGKSFHCG